MIIVQSPSGIWKEHHQHLAIFFSPWPIISIFLKLSWKSVQDFSSYFAHKETSASCHMASLVEKVITVCGTISAVNGDLDRKGKKPPHVLTIAGGPEDFSITLEKLWLTLRIFSNLWVCLFVCLFLILRVLFNFVLQCISWIWVWNVMRALTQRSQTPCETWSIFLMEACSSLLCAGLFHNLLDD